MNNQQRIETRSVSEKTHSTTHNGLRADTVKLVEMGNVSVETKGTIRGLELGFTPRF